MSKELTTEQKQAIIDFWNDNPSPPIIDFWNDNPSPPPDLQDLINAAFPGENVDGRTKQRKR
jgi:hypothetical protein